MSSGRNLSAAPEAALCGAAACQYIKDAYNVPVGICSLSTDSHMPDGQSGFETAMLGVLCALNSGGDLIIDAGHLSTFQSVSPLKLIADAKAIAILNRIRAGVKVDNDTMAVQELLNVKPGGHFLENAHTLKHCRDAVRVPLYDTGTLESWQAEGSKSFYARALDIYRELKKELKPLDLPEDVKKELNSIVKKADDKLAK